MQMGVQGAWGIIPAHLNELAPDATRGLVPGLAYQLGILFAAPVNTIEYALRDRVGYGWALASFETATILTLAGLAARRLRAPRASTSSREPASPWPIVSVRDEVCRFGLLSDGE